MFTRRSLFLYVFAIGIFAVVAAASTTSPPWNLLYAAGAALLHHVYTRHFLNVQDAGERARRLLDEQLAQSKKLASIGEMSSGIAHEINTPLAVIGQEAEWMSHLLSSESLNAIPEAVELKESLTAVTTQVRRCGEITHKLLNFARKENPVFQPADPARLFEDMAVLVAREAESRNIAITRHYPAEPLRLETDPPLLRQVILNLLNNAVQAVGRDGHVEIGVCPDQAPNWLDLYVTDSGCGIAKENLEKIFDPFFTTKPPGQGTGLGLSICHSIVVKLGGSIEVSSQPGQGSTFTVRLPVKHTAKGAQA